MPLSSCCPASYHAHVLRGEHLEAVRVAAAAYLDGGMTAPEVPTALCNTHWLPLGTEAELSPQHALEAAVVAVVRSAIGAALPPLRNDGGATVAGVEWWLQEQWPDDLPKELHTDCSVCVPRADDDAPKHPLVSSVLYLSETGGPTAVFLPAAGAAEAAASDEPLTTSGSYAVALGFPRAGALLLFQGDLLHCVLHPPPPPLAAAPTEAQPRRTLLVNFWAAKPPGATQARLTPLEALPSFAPEAAAAGAAPAAEANGASPRRAPSARTHWSAASSARVLPLPRAAPLSADVRCWTEQQRVPQDVCDDLVVVAVAQLPLVVVEYAVEPGAADGGGTGGGAGSSSSSSSGGGGSATAGHVADAVVAAPAADAAAAAGSAEAPGAEAAAPPFVCELSEARLAAATTEAAREAAARAAEGEARWVVHFGCGSQQRKHGVALSLEGRSGVRVRATHHTRCSNPSAFRAQCTTQAAASCASRCAWVARDPRRTRAWRSSRRDGPSR